MLVAGSRVCYKGSEGIISCDNQNGTFDIILDAGDVDADGVDAGVITLAEQTKRGLNQPVENPRQRELREQTTAAVAVVGARVNDADSAPAKTIPIAKYAFADSGKKVK
jgi:hypothetical protein